MGHTVNTPNPLNVLIPGDISTTLATQQAITGFSFVTQPNRYYIMDGVIHNGCSGVGGVKFSISAPVATVLFCTITGFTSAGSILVNSIINSLDVLGPAYTTLNNTNGNIRFIGHLLTGATGGIVQFNYASATAGQTSTIYSLCTGMLVTETVEP